MTFQGWMRFKVFVCVCMTLLGVAGCGAVVGESSPDVIRQMGRDLNETVNKQIERVIEEYERLQREKEDREKTQNKFGNLSEQLKELRVEINEYRKSVELKLEKLRDRAHDEVEKAREKADSSLTQFKKEQHDSTLLIWIAIGAIVAIITLAVTLSKLIMKPASESSKTQTTTVN